MPKSKEKFEILIEDLKKDFKVAFDGISTLRNEMRRGFDDAKGQLRLVDDKLTFVAKELGGKIDKVDKKLDEHISQPA